MKACRPVITDLAKLHTYIDTLLVVSKIGALAAVECLNCNATQNKLGNITEFSRKCKIRDYAKDYANEFLFIRGIDKYFMYFLDNINKADKGVFENHRVDKINKLIHRFEKAQRLNYLHDISDKEIDERDVCYSDALFHRLSDFGDYYVNDEWEFDEEMFDKYVHIEFPGYQNLVACIELFHTKFEINYKLDKYKVNWPNIDDSDEIDY